LGAVDIAQRFVLEQFARSLRPLVPGLEILGLGDFTVDGRKFAGSAQRRLKRWFLVHITVLYDFRLDKISRYLAIPGRQPGYREGRSHEDFLMNLGLSRKIVRNALRMAWMTSPQDLSPVPVPRDLVCSLVQDKFSTPSWVERF
jgi:lipoate-protein ligase A